MFFKNNEKNNMTMSRTELSVLTLVSVGLTLPFIFYCRDMTRSLRKISEAMPKRSFRRRPLQKK